MFDRYLLRGVHPAHLEEARKHTLSSAHLFVESCGRAGACEAVDDVIFDAISRILRLHGHGGVRNESGCKVSGAGLGKPTVLSRRHDQNNPAPRTEIKFAHLANRLQNLQSEHIIWRAGARALYSG